MHFVGGDSFGYFQNDKSEVIRRLFGTRVSPRLRTRRKTRIVLVVNKAIRVSKTNFDKCLHTNEVQVPSSIGSFVLPRNGNVTHTVDELSPNDAELWYFASLSRSIMLMILLVLLLIVIILLAFYCSYLLYNKCATCVKGVRLRPVMLCQS